jgi:hypothetical protein
MSAMPRSASTEKQIHSEPLSLDQLLAISGGLTRGPPTPEPSGGMYSGKTNLRKLSNHIEHAQEIADWLTPRVHGQSAAWLGELKKHLARAGARVEGERHY